jgi:oligoribonuclease NrnB/cAMP/cGMP phosphodiesterase (DHH superfamily)
MKNTLCIYHRLDLDGRTSAAIVKEFWLQENPGGITHFKNENTHIEKADVWSFEHEKSKRTISFHGWNYGDEIPEFCPTYDRIIMCDISFPPEEMLKLNNRHGSSFIWIDHHKSAMEKNNNFLIAGNTNVELSACELTWEYFFPAESMPELVRLFGVYDTHRYLGTDEEENVLNTQYGARALVKNYDEVHKFLFNPKGCDPVMLMQYGLCIMEYLKVKMEDVYKSGFGVEVKDGENTHKFICINANESNPSVFGIDYHKDGYAGVIYFYNSDKSWKFVIYNDNGKVDCSKIASYYSKEGGGHRGSAGFSKNGLPEFITSRL